MKANNLTISIPNKGCDKNCPYCVSRCTGSVKTNQSLMMSNIEKVLTLAKNCQVSSVLITGKGEPCLNWESVLRFTQIFKEFPVEMQTNGIFLSEKPELISRLAKVGMNVIAISIDDGKTKIAKLVEAIHENDLLCRVSFNVTNQNALGHDTFMDLFNWLKEEGVDQFTLRNIVTPNFTKETTESQWIKQNVDSELYLKLVEEMKKQVSTIGHHLRSLPYGAKVYDLHGVAVSFSDFCIQDNNNNDDIRSLIFQEDGHLYTSWNSKASALL